MVSNPETVRTDILVRGETRFQEPSPITPTEQNSFGHIILKAMLTLSSGDPNTPAAAFDFQRMAEERGPLQLFQWQGVKPTNLLLQDLSEEYRLATQWQKQRSPWSHKPREMQLLSFAKSATGTDVRIVSAVRSNAHRVTYVDHVRWWLKQDPRTQRWAVYDFDDPDLHLRFSIRSIYEIQARVTIAPQMTVTGDVMGAAPAEDDSNNLLAILRAGFDAVSRDNAAELTMVLLKLPEASQIPAIESLRQVLHAYQNLFRNRPADAQKALEHILQSNADIPAAILALAATKNQLKRQDEALMLIAQYRQLTGNSPLAWREAARARAGKSDKAGAIEAIRKGLVETPGSIPLLLEYYRLLPETSLEDLGIAVASAGLRSGVRLHELLALLDQIPEPPTVEVMDRIVSGFRSRLPTDPYGLFEQSLVQLSQGRNEQARRSIQEACTFSRDMRAKKESLRSLIGRVVRRGKPEEVYLASVACEPSLVVREVGDRLLEPIVRATPDSPVGLDLLAKLHEIAKRHQSLYPDDPWGHFYAAQVAEFRGEFHTADALLRTGMSLLPVPNETTLRRFESEQAGAQKDSAGANWERFRHLRTLVLFRQGKWKQAYSELTPTGDTFDQLVQLMDLPEGGSEQRLALLQEHARRHPGDSVVPFLKGKEHWNNQQYELATESLAAYLNMENGRHRMAAHEMLIRSLIRLRRLDEANARLREMEPEAESSAMRSDRDRVFVLRACLEVSQGNGVAFFESLPGNVREWADRFYADEDLGPLLRSGQFDEFRKRYPPPSKSRPPISR